MRFALNGAEPIDVTAVRAFLDAGARFGLPETAVVCAYGMAEATLAVSFPPVGHPAEGGHRAGHRVGARAACGAGGRQPSSEPPVRRSSRCWGRRCDGIEVAVVGEDGGQLRRARGRRAAPARRGRHRPLPDRRRARPTKGADGWLDTGDLGYLVDGEVVICGRVKDVIIMGGRNIYPTDVERVAETVEGVRAGNAVAVRWTTPGGRESFALAVESRQAGGPGGGGADRRRDPLGGHRGDRGPTGRGEGAAGRHPAEDAVGQAQALRGRRADRLGAQQAMLRSQSARPRGWPNYEWTPA